MSLLFTWIDLDFYSISDAQTVFTYLFCVFNSLQGFVIFVFFVLREKNARRLWSQGRRRTYVERMCWDWRKQVLQQKEPKYVDSATWLYLQTSFLLTIIMRNWFDYWSSELDVLIYLISRALINLLRHQLPLVVGHKYIAITNIVSDFLTFITNVYGHTIPRKCSVFVIF